MIEATKTSAQTADIEAHRKRTKTHASRHSKVPTKDDGNAFKMGSNRDNSPLSEWIGYGFNITVLLVTERILGVFAKEAEVL